MSDRKYGTLILGFGSIIVSAAICLTVLANTPLTCLAATSPTRIVVIPDPSIYRAGIRLKVENERIIIWAPSSELSKDHQIQVFDLAGREVLSLNLLGAIPGAREVTISDASVSPKGMLAIGIQAFAGKDHGRPFILVLDSAGSLYSSTSLRKVLGVSKIEMDNDENIWMLGLGCGDSDPSKVPALTKLDRDGNTLGEFFYFSNLQGDSRLVHEGLSVGGDVGMGLTQSKIWFWLPSNRELLTIALHGSESQRLTTDLPVWPRAVADGSTMYAQKPSSMESGNLLAQVTLLDSSSNGASPSTSFFEFAAESGSWREVTQSDLTGHGGIFLGIDKGRVVFAAYKGDTSAIEVDWVPLAF
jgi:hypothetical protein